MRGAGGNGKGEERKGGSHFLALPVVPLATSLFLFFFSFPTFRYSSIKEPLRRRVADTRKSLELKRQKVKYIYIYIYYFAAVTPMLSIKDIQYLRSCLLQSKGAFFWGYSSYSVLFRFRNNRIHGIPISKRTLLKVETEYP